jgi:hypothetical protein
MGKDRGFLLPKKQCEKLLKETKVRIGLVKSHFHEYSDLEKSHESLKILCELFLSLDGMSVLLKLAESGPIKQHKGTDHYVVTEEEGFLLQSLYLPAILELKKLAELHGISLTVN